MVLEHEGCSHARAEACSDLQTMNVQCFLMMLGLSQLYQSFVSMLQGLFALQSQHQQPRACHASYYVQYHK